MKILLNVYFTIVCLSFKTYSQGTLHAGSGLRANNDGVTFSLLKFNPCYLAIDNQGVVYVSDDVENKIWKVSNGVISHFAGSGVNKSKDGSALMASFSMPRGITIDQKGNVYVAERESHKIRKINLKGEVSTYAGSGILGNKDGIANLASFNAPEGMCIDKNGNIYITDIYNNNIRKIDTNGIVSTIAGSGRASMLNGMSLEACFNEPKGMMIDSYNNLFVADSKNQRIRRIKPSGDVSTLVGNGTSGNYNEYTLTSSLNFPHSLVFDIKDNLIVSEESNNLIRKIDIFADTVTNFSGNGIRGNINGVASISQFNNPAGMVMDSENNLYIADYKNKVIRKIDTLGTSTIWAGELEASFNLPEGIVADNDNNIYIADTYNHKIRKISNTGIVSTMAGSGIAGYKDGSALEASFNYPSGIAMDAQNNIYVADTDNNMIRKISNLGIVSTVAGKLTAGDVIGNVQNAQFNHPKSIAIDTLNNLYITDTDNKKIKKITNMTTVSVLAGEKTSINSPISITVDANRNVYFIENETNIVHQITNKGVLRIYNGTGKQNSINDIPTSLTVDKAGILYIKVQSGIRKIINSETDVLINTDFINGNKESICIDNNSGTLYISNNQDNKIYKVQNSISTNGLKIQISNFISPNDDGINDYLNIDLIELFPIYIVKLYSPWGKLIFEQQNYKNNWQPDQNHTVGTYNCVIEDGDNTILMQQFISIIK